MDYLYYNRTNGNFQPSLHSMKLWLGTRMPKLFVGANPKSGCFIDPEVFVDIALVVVAFLVLELGGLGIILSYAIPGKHGIAFVIFCLAVVTDIICTVLLHVNKASIHKLVLREELLLPGDPQIANFQSQIRGFKRNDKWMILLLFASAVGKMFSFSVLLQHWVVIYPPLFYFVAVGYTAVAAIHVFRTCYVISLIRAWYATREDYRQRGAYLAHGVGGAQAIQGVYPVDTLRVGIGLGRAARWTLEAHPAPGAAGMETYTLDGSGILLDQDAMALLNRTGDAGAQDKLFSAIRHIQLGQSNN